MLDAGCWMLDPPAHPLTQRRVSPRLVIPTGGTKRRSGGIHGCRDFLHHRFSDSIVGVAQRDELMGESAVVADSAPASDPLIAAAVPAADNCRCSLPLSRSTAPVCCRRFLSLVGRIQHRASGIEHRSGGRAAPLSETDPASAATSTLARSAPRRTVAPFRDGRGCSTPGSQADDGWRRPRLPG